jgi:hypothetical protein
MTKRVTTELNKQNGNKFDSVVKNVNNYIGMVATRKWLSLEVMCM